MRNIWISGSINSGKTTVSKIIGKELGMVILELDSLSCFVDHIMDFKSHMRLNYELVPDIVKIYNKKGLSVIVVYPILESKNYNLIETCRDFTFFTIDPGIDIAIRDRGGRKLSEWERDKVVFHYDRSVNDISFAIRILTKDLTPEETAQAIISCILSDNLDFNN